MPFPVHRSGDADGHLGQAGAKKIIRREACQLLALKRLGSRALAPDAPIDWVETGRKSQTQSSGRPDGLNQQIEACFYPWIETTAERQTPLIPFGLQGA